MHIFILEKNNLELTLSMLAGCATLISFIMLCSFCYKRKPQTDSDDEDDDDDLFAPKSSPTKEPLMKTNRNGNGSTFSFLNVTHDKRNRAASTPTTTSPSIPVPSPGWGRKSLKFGEPPNPTSSFESIGVQPKSKELSSSHDSIVSSCSSIPTEPDASNDRGEELGSIYFSVSYDPYDLVLKLTIQKAVNLPAKDLSGTSDPFVKVLLLPDKKNKLETRVKRKKLNPIWNEVFTFEGFPHQKLIQRTLYLQVLDYDRFSRNDPIGEIELNLGDIVLQSDPVPFVKKLNPCKRASVSISS